MTLSMQQIFEAIDLIFEDYGERQIKRLINTTGLQADEMHEIRGKCQATRDLRNALKNQLGDTN